MLAEDTRLLGQRQKTLLPIAQQTAWTSLMDGGVRWLKGEMYLITDEIKIVQGNVHSELHLESLPILESKYSDSNNKPEWCVLYVLLTLLWWLDMIGNLYDYMIISPTRFRDAKNDTDVGTWLLAFQSWSQRADLSWILMLKLNVNASQTIIQNGLIIALHSLRINGYGELGKG